MSLWAWYSIEYAGPIIECRGQWPEVSSQSGRKPLQRVTRHRRRAACLRAKSLRRASPADV